MQYRLPFLPNKKTPVERSTRVLDSFKQAGIRSRFLPEMLRTRHKTLQKYGIWYEFTTTGWLFRPKLNDDVEYTFHRRTTALFQ